MANKYPSTGSGVDDGLTAAISFNTVLTTWNALLTGAFCIPAFGQIGSIADEWQAFVSRRLREDVALLRGLSRCTGPDQIAAAYAEFWRKAVEDYADEAARMTRLVTDTSSKMAVVAQSATEEASTRVLDRKAS